MSLLKSTNNKWVASSWWCWFIQWKSVWWGCYDCICLGWTGRACKRQWVQHRCTLARSLLLSPFLQQVWGKGWERAGLEMEGWGMDFRRSPWLQSIFPLWVWGGGGCLLAPACCRPGGRKKQKTFASAGRGVSMTRRKDQVNSRREVRGSRLCSVERTVAWKLCFCFLLAGCWWGSRFCFLSLIFLIYKIRVITCLPGLCKG